jgi:predicted P-loop ATPase
MTVSKLGEAKRLYDIGFGIHHLRPNSKVPVKPGWTDGERDPYSLLKQDYKTGYNLGTKLGKPSQVGEGYLAVLDVDVKGSEKRHKATAAAWVEENFPGLLDSAPITLSGRGNGSMHIWVLVDSPLESHALYASNEQVEVFMPSAKSTEKQIEILGRDKVDAGWRLRPAFEIDFMCIGRQVVLPPSIHPDTGKEYKWKRPINSPEDLTLVDMTELLSNVQMQKRVGAPRNRTKVELLIVDVEDTELEMRLPPTITSAIFEGSDVKDRSAMCLSIALSMVSAGFKDEEILGVLTNRDFFIGDVAYEHSKSSYRQRAARWAFDYCVQKARHQADVAFQFSSEVVVEEKLSPEKAQKQHKELVSDLGQVNWKKLLEKTDSDNTKPSYKNIIIILQNDVSPEVFRLDLFGMIQTCSMETPWGGVADKKVSDQDYLNIKNWLTNKWKIQPNLNLIKEAVDTIAGMNSYHSVRDHLDALPAWDGEPRLDSWMKRLLGAKAPEPYLSAVSSKFLMCSIARIFNPGCKVDSVVIFEGMQGIGKSTVGRILATDKWFLDNLPDLHDKDSSLVIQGNWFVEMGELSTIRRADAELVKGYITRTTDKFRPPYGKNVEEFDRQCVFFGTTNRDDYLKDKTGNRRFLPVAVSTIDLEGLKDERNQLFAEAMFRYEMGEKTYLERDTKEYEQSQKIQIERVSEDESDVMVGLVYDWALDLRKKRNQLLVQGVKLKKLSFKIEDLFSDFASSDFGENVRPPLVEFAKHPYKYQMAGAALIKAGFQRYVSEGRSKWREKSPTI